MIVLTLPFFIEGEVKIEPHIEGDYLIFNNQNTGVKTQLLVSMIKRVTQEPNKMGEPSTTIYAGDFKFPIEYSKVKLETMINQYKERKDGIK